MHKFQGFAESAVGPLRRTLKNLNGSRALDPVIDHDANWPGLHIVWSSSCTLKSVQLFPSIEPYNVNVANYMICTHKSQSQVSYPQLNVKFQIPLLEGNETNFTWKFQSRM